MAEQAGSSVVLEEDEGGVRTLTMNRPERRNTLSGDLVEGLIEALERAGHDESVRVVVLTGAGDKAFCAGGDLAGQQGSGFLELHDQRGRFAELLRTLVRSPKPTIARVQGACLGGGFGLALGCDLAVGAEEATFGTPEIKVGLFPMMIMTLIFRNVGRKKAMEMMLTGKRIDAAEAERIGVLNRTAAAGELDDATRELAERVASFSPATMRLGREATARVMEMSFDDSLAYLHDQLTLNTMLEDASEGVRAFFTKKEPEWKGR